MRCRKDGPEGQKCGLRSQVRVVKMQLFDVISGFDRAKHLRQERDGAGESRRFGQQAVDELAGEVMNATFLRGKQIQDLLAVVHLVANREARNPTYERR